MNYGDACIMPDDFLSLLKKGTVHISVYYGGADLVDEESLIEEAQKKGLNVTFLKGGLKGIVKVSLSVIPLHITSLNLFNDFVGVQFKGPLTASLRKANNEAEIKAFLQKTNYLRNFCQLAIVINKLIKGNREVLDSIERHLQRYAKFLGPGGIELFLSIFKEIKEKNIVNNYASYQDFILKKFSIETFISQQLNQNYLTIIAIDTTTIQPKGSAYVASLSGLDHLVLRKVNWHHAFLEQRTELYVPNGVANLVILPQSPHINKANDALIGLRLLFQNINSGINLMKNVLEQEEDILSEEFENFPSYVEGLRNSLISMSMENVEDMQNLILASQNSLTSSIIDLYNPIKRELQKYVYRKDRASSSLLTHALSKPLVDGQGMQFALQKLNLPPEIQMQLPAAEMVKVYRIVSKKIGNLQSIQNVFRELNSEMETLKHEKKLRQSELRETDSKERLAREALLKQRLDFIIDKVIKVFEIFKRSG